jgi:hypothetical protein
MNENFEKQFEAIKNERLTDTERILMRNDLQLFMSEHAPRAPLAIRFWDYIRESLAGFDTRSPRTQFVPAAFALVLIVGIGTSYAAENALPGDVLYPIKIHVNESVQGSLAVSQASKAEWNTQLMTRRLEEAETLTVQDRLTPVARADIQTQLLKSAQSFDENVAALAGTDNGAAAVATVQSNLEASLEGHVQVLAALTADVPAVQAAADPIIATAALQVSESRVARTSAEAIVASSTSPGVMRAAFAGKATAKQAVSAVRADVAATVATTTVHAAAKRVFKAEQSISSGNDQLKRGEYAKAFSIFQEAIRAARSAQSNLDASVRLNTDTTAAPTDTPDGTDTMDTSVSATPVIGQ